MANILTNPQGNKCMNREKCSMHKEVLSIYLYFFTSKGQYNGKMLVAYIPKIWKERTEIQNPSQCAVWSSNLCTNTKQNQFDGLCDLIWQHSSPTLTAQILHLQLISFITFVNHQGQFDIAEPDHPQFCSHETRQSLTMMNEHSKTWISFHIVGSIQTTLKNPRH